mmetsp:Transcript_8534/g.20663  ORF Transcript_8534/g.20663 Transcript_8534/m.20663 type:complete len:253 (+) Transcript_8534:701-1459(+)
MQADNKRKLRLHARHNGASSARADRCLRAELLPGLGRHHRRRGPGVPGLCGARRFCARVLRLRVVPVRAVSGVDGERGRRGETGGRDFHGDQDEHLDPRRRAGRGGEANKGAQAVTAHVHAGAERRRKRQQERPSARRGRGKQQNRVEGRDHERRTVVRKVAKSPPALFPQVRHKWGRQTRLRRISCHLQRGFFVRYVGGTARYFQEDGQRRQWLLILRGVHRVHVDPHKEGAAVQHCEDKRSADASVLVNE